eukprot:Skav203618  [mRNA]  locus=scaffold935:772026:773708:- [translate_table: standard]
MLIFGGDLGPDIGPLVPKKYGNDLWSYDLKANQWIEIEPSGPVPEARQGHSAVCMEHQMLIFGGSYRNDLWAYDPKANKWTEIKPEGPLPKERAFHSAVCIGDQMVIAGGWPSFDAWSYNQKANTWIEIKSSGMIRSQCSAVSMGDQMLIFGGKLWYGLTMNELWSYDPKANEWMRIEPEGPLPVRRQGHSAVCMEHEMLIFGGNAGIGAASDSKYRNDLWAYDPKANKWIEIKPEGPLPVGRDGHSATCMGDKMLIFGGHNGGTWRNDLWAYALKVAKPHAGYQVSETIGESCMMQEEAAAAHSQTPRVARTFAKSAFKELYNECELSTDYDILHFAHDYISWLKKESFEDAQMVNRKLVAKIREGFTVAQLAIFTWTLMDRVHDRELCSYMNEIVREDRRERLQPLIPLVRAMNSFLVTRGKRAADWPSDNITYRGAGIPDEHMGFFQSGLQYRCPMFLATSFDHGVAMDFARDNRKDGKRMVVFHVHYHAQLRCVHVNYLEEGVSDAGSEKEFLFPPYSAFTVKSAPEQDGETFVIHIEAFPDNTEASEHLPLAYWH